MRSTTIWRRETPSRSIGRTGPCGMLCFPLLEVVLVLIFTGTAPIYKPRLDQSIAESMIVEQSVNRNLFAGSAGARNAHVTTDSDVSTIESPHSTVGFVGLGQMGFHMAHRLREADVELIVFDVDTARANEFIEQHGGAVAREAGDWACCDVVLLMLPNSAIVEDVLDGEIGSALSPGALIIDMSSSEPVRTRALAAALMAKGLRMLDAPVSGGVKGASEGRLSIMVGGAAVDLAQARPLLELLGSKVFHVGGPGTGHAAKALNNMVSAATFSITAEALHVGERFGINPGMLNTILNASSGRSNTSENKIEQFVLSGTEGSGFSLRLMAKDVHIATDLARQVKFPVPIGDAIDSVWSTTANDIEPSTDHTAMYRLRS
ncbi:NAD(P)-dependent oxidoreductase [Rhodoglobus aureus]|uniref:NAD(P)-dependent oxidoreductase n=1 Tax=Rhodoglobus aureus TaxID=191497 RepID=UPI0031CEB7C4